MAKAAGAAVPSREDLLVGASMEGSPGSPQDSPAPRRRRWQRGNALVVTLIALTGLATLGAITVATVQGGLTSATSERSHAVALYAAEAGAMVGMDYIKAVYNPTNHFSYVTRLSNDNPETPPGLPGNEAPPGDPSNIFSADMNAWYRVTVLNNPSDPAFANYDASLADEEDSDSRIILRSVGFGPDSATATIEVTLYYDDVAGQFVILGWQEAQ